MELNVPEAKDYRLVYDIDLSHLSEHPEYSVDHHAEITQAFDRVAYCLELGGDDGDVNYAFVSMDAFTQDAGKIGIPTAGSGAFFQQDVNNMDVFSDVKGVVAGQGLEGGNIEFWPNNYLPNNSAKVPGASDSLFDFGDEPSSEARDGYGSMQVHNHAAKQTILAVNHWREGEKADLGIGNQSEKNPDWTFSANAGSYTFKRLRVLVRLKQ